MSEDQKLPEYRKTGKGVKVSFKSHESVETFRFGLTKAIEGALSLMAAHGRKCDCGLCKVARGTVYTLRLWRFEIDCELPPTPAEVEAAWDEVGNMRASDTLDDFNAARKEREKEKPEAEEGDPESADEGEGEE
jgi:hypothetical protein